MAGGIAILLFIILVGIVAIAAMWIFGIGLFAKKDVDRRPSSRAPQGPHPEQAARERSTLYPPAGG